MRVLEVAPDFPPVVRGGGAQTFYLLAYASVRNFLMLSCGHEVKTVT